MSKAVELLTMSCPQCGELGRFSSEGNSVYCKGKPGNFCGYTLTAEMRDLYFKHSKRSRSAIDHDKYKRKRGQLPGVLASELAIIKHCTSATIRNAMLDGEFDVIATMNPRRIILNTKALDWSPKKRGRKWS